MIKRNFAAKRSKAIFLSSVNDIDVYVEDASRETKKLFSRLLSNSWQGRIKFESVVPLGSRAEVLEACSSDQEVGGRRPRAYIIDGDLDLCCKVPVRNLKRLYRLPRYCVENYLIEESAVAMCLAYESEEMDFEDIVGSLDFDGWVDLNSAPLRRLFLGYAAAVNLNSGVKNVGTPLSNFKSDASGLIDSLKVESFLLDLRNSVDLALGSGAFDFEYARIDKDMALIGNRDFFLNYVSGKDYLFPLLKLRMNQVLHMQRRDGLLKCNIAENVYANELADILTVAA